MLKFYQIWTDYDSAVEFYSIGELELDFKKYVDEVRQKWKTMYNLINDYNGELLTCTDYEVFLKKELQQYGLYAIEYLTIIS